MISSAPEKFIEPSLHGMGELIDRAAQRWPEKIAIVDPEANSSVTYAELKGRSQSVAAWLNELGLSEGSKIAVSAGNSVAALELLTGAFYAGVVPVPCNPDLGPEQLAYVLGHCDAKYLFASKENCHALANALQKCERKVEVIEVGRRLELQASDLRSKEGDPHDDVLIVYTSGTTGMPKGVLQRISGLFSSIENTAITYNLSEEDRFLCVLPVHHGNSIHKIFATWLTGGTVVLPPRFEVRSFWHWVDHHRCTWLALVPSIISQLLRFNDDGEHPSVRFARSSSAPLPTSWHHDFEEKFGISLMQGMGSTETGPLFSNPLPPEVRKIGSPGKSVVRQEVKIIDSDGNTLADNEEGLILVRGPSRMKGYYKDPEATATVLTHDGWICTGDIGHRDSEGYFFITGRAKEIIIKAGVNISLREIDDALLSHPNIVDAAGAGIEDVYLGEDVVAYVVLEPGSVLNESQLLDFCVEKLGSFKTPSEILQVVEIPRLQNGKVQRHLLKERFGPQGRSSTEKAPRPKSSQAFVKPRTPMETIIGRVWAEHLDQESIGIHDDFFALGGYSLLAIRMLAPLRKELGPALTLTTFFEHPNIAEQAMIAAEQKMQRLLAADRQNLLKGLSEYAKVEKNQNQVKQDDLSEIHKLTLESRITLETALLQNLDKGKPEDRILPRPAAEFCPLSFAQQRIWFLEQLSPESTMYNSGDAIRLRGHLDIEALQCALNGLMDRHEILRTSIHTIDGQPWQKFRNQLHIKIQREDLSHLPDPEKESAMQRLISSTLKGHYALGQDPLIRATIIKLNRDDHIFVLSRHNLVTDGWSNRIILQELNVMYGDHIHGRKSELPRSPIQYGDFAFWQREQLQGENFRKESEYWANRLKGIPTLLNLPTDRPRPKVQAHTGHRQDFQLDEGISRRILESTRQLQVSPFTALSAAFATLLYRYSGQTDFVFGLPIADRDRPELQYLVGLLLDTHVIRFSLSDETLFQDVLAQTRSEVAESYAHKDLPFELVVDAVQPERNSKHMPLCQVLLNWSEASTRLKSLKLEGLSTEGLLLHDQTAKFDISVSFTDSNQGIHFEIEYDSVLFEAETIRRMAGHFQRLLEGATSNPACPVGSLPLMTDSEQSEILTVWNDTATDYPHDRCIHQLFEDQVLLTPDAVAVAFEDEELSYNELNLRANSLARYLISQGAGPEVPVGLCMERSLDVIVGLLAILKTGGVYVPLDPTYPKERLAFMLKDTAAKIVLTQEKLLNQLPKHEGRTLCLDRDWLDLRTDKSENPVSTISGTSLAYVIYTSGSTGTPKGILLPHTTLVNLLSEGALTKRSGRVAQFTSISFDVSLQEIFYALLSGNTLVVMDDETRLRPEAFAAFMKDKAITDLFVPNTVLHYFIQAAMEAKLHLKALTNIFQAGEALTVTPLVRAFFENHPDCRLHNHYGPAESLVVTTHKMPRDPGTWIDNPTIGKPVSNTRVYILDRQQTLVPIGVPGEIYLASAGLARGYLNRQELNAKKFVPDPYSGLSGERMYRTGDLARYLPDGNIEFIGRVDFQVKIRGLRIELGEIETMLSEHPAVDQVVVLAREDALGDKRLVAYVVPTEAVFCGTEPLQAFLSERLPDYMLPAAYVVLERLPLTPNSKIDRLALPKPQYDQRNLGGKFVPPRNPLEELIAGVWCEVLKLKQVGVYDNFFQLGGHSLLATQAVARLEKLVKAELPLRRFFEAPTVYALAIELKRAMSKDGTGDARSIVPLPRTSRPPLSFAQQRLWFLDRLLHDKSVYNMCSVWDLQGALDVEALHRSIQLVVERHEVLRTRFAVSENEPVQVIDTPRDFEFPITDLNTLEQSERQPRALELAEQEARQPFDLNKDPLLRARLIRLSAEEHILQLATHHIVSDGWSTGIISKELTTAYNAFVSGHSPELPALSIQYADYAVWQRKWLHGEVLENQSSYWKEKLEDLSPLVLPTDRQRPPLSSNKGAHLFVDLPESTLAALRELGLREGTTLFMTLLSAFKVLLYRYSGQDDIAVGTPIAGRGLTELEGLIGFFVNTLVIRDDLSGNPGFNELLARVKESALQAYTHQDIPFEKLVEELSPDRDTSQNPLFQVMFILQNAPREPLSFDAIETSRLTIARNNAKFDLKLALTETETGLRASWEFSTELFDKQTIERMAQHYITLLEGIVADSSQPIGQLPLLTEPERHQLLVEWNDTETEYPKGLGVHELFEQQVARAPNAVAVVFEENEITYDELNKRANRLAHYLISEGAGPEINVGLCMERSVDLIVGQIAILKTGGVYVPLDPSYPKERLEFMLKDTAAPILLTKQKLLNQLPAHEGRTSCMDRDWPDSSAQDNENPDSKTSATSPAYVIYTSGSTGNPKGILLPHATLVNLLWKDAQSKRSGRVAQFTSISFDVSLQEVFFALLSGKTLVVMDDETRLRPQAFASFMKEQAITDLFVPNVVLHYLVRAVVEAKLHLDNLVNPNVS
jgi:amino acid adenylation domain-containing protein